MMQHLVPMLLRGNADVDAPAVLSFPTSAGTGRWSVRTGVPTLEHGNEHGDGMKTHIFSNHEKGENKCKEKREKIIRHEGHEETQSFQEL